MPPCVLVPPLLSPALPVGSTTTGRKKRAFQSHGKLVGLPQSFLVWAYKNEQTINARKKELTAVIRLNICRALTSAELGEGKMQQQVRVWQNRNKTQKLGGEYVSWGVEVLDQLREPAGLLGLKGVISSSPGV